MGQQEVKAFTFIADGIVPAVTIDVGCSEIGATSSQKTIKALWDTGATKTTISSKIADEFNLPTIAMTQVHTANETVTARAVPLQIYFPNDTVFAGQVNACNLGDSKIDMLIGMDIISSGDLAISNFQGKTILTFRMPSFAPIDFVQSFKNAQPAKKEQTTGRNSPCPCGSGKKYKNCCIDVK